MSISHNAGLGPWFCSLYFSLAKSPKKQTDLRIHTYPLLLERMMNGTHSTSFGNNSGGWVIIMMVGHFEQRSDAIAFHTLWSKQTRGKTRRIQRGIALYYTYRRKYRLRLWMQPWQRSHAREEYARLYPDDIKTYVQTPSSTPEQIQLLNTSLVLSKVHKLQQTRVKRKRKR